MLLDRVKLEFIGSFLLFYITGMASINYQIEAIDLKSLSIIYFLTYTLTLWLAKPMSQAHFNPSLSLAQTLTKHTKLTNLPFYLFAQLLAAIFSGSMIKLTLSKDISHKILNDTILGNPKPSDYNVFLFIFLEALGTFFLVLGYYLLVEEKDAKKYIYAPGLGGLFAGVSVYLYVITGAGLNWGKCFGFALLSGRWSGFWEYFVGGCLGAVLGGVVGNLLLSEKVEVAIKRKKDEKKRRRNTVLEEGIEKNLLREVGEDDND